MTRRAVWLVVVSLLIPGSAQVLAGNRGFGRFVLRVTFTVWALVVLVAVGYLVARGFLFTALTNPIVLWIVQGILAFVGVLWVVVTIDTLRLVRIVRLGRIAKPVIAVTLIAALGFGGSAAAWGVYTAGVTRDAVSDVFDAGVIEPPVDGRYNILLLGGDAGPDRDGLRPDSISVVSVDAATGEATIIGLPRNLEFVPFVEGSPMAELYPDGFGVRGCDVDACMLNSIYTEVELKHPDLYPDAVAEGSKPGIEGMRDAVEGVTGLTIQYYTLIDMQGFSDLIDALGGVTIESTGRYPMNGDLTADGQPINVTQWIEPGVQHMDGFTALFYARIRHGSSDYDRMARQRQVQEAILQQFEPANVLVKFQAVAKAGAQVVSTDIPQSMLGTFIDLASKAKGLEIEKIELVPPLVDPEDPSYSSIRTTIADALGATAPTPAP